MRQMRRGVVALGLLLALVHCRHRRRMAVVSEDAPEVTPE
jgi:hypothetical protein